MDSEMDYVTAKFLVILCLMIFLCPIAKGMSSIRCDEVYFAELGKKSTIACDLQGTYDVYWFKGESTSAYPLLSFEDATYGGQAYNGGEYELTEDMSLRILRTQLRHEGFFTVRAYINQYDFNTTTVELKVYRQPDPPCPVIDVCNSSCGGCLQSSNAPGQLTCYLNSIRPRFDLNWIVVNHSEVEFTNYKQIVVSNELHGTWNISTTIDYAPTGCGTEATYSCVASLSELYSSSVLVAYNNTVVIFTELCEESPPFSTEKIVVVVVAIVTLSLIMFGMLIIFILKRRKGTNREKNKRFKVRYKPVSKTEVTPPGTEELKKILTDALANHYRKLCFIKPLPWGEPISIKTLYTACLCTVTTIDGNINNCTSDYLSADDFNLRNNRVLITADMGFGKTTFTQTLVQKWLSELSDKASVTRRKDNKDDYILIYIHLKEVTSNIAVSKVVNKMLPMVYHLTPEAIDKVLQTYQCRLVLDGLDELSMSTEDAIPSSDLEPDMQLTVANVLGNNINTNKYRNIKVWATSRVMDHMNSDFTLPYTKVELKGFGENQFNEYVHKVCKYYYDLENVPELPLVLKSQMGKTTSNSNMQSLPKENNNSLTEESAKLPAKTEKEDVKGGQANLPDTVSSNMNLKEHSLKEVQTNTDKTSQDILERNVANFIDFNEVIQTFSTTPMLLIMIIHIVTCRMLIPTGKFENVHVNKLTTIIRLVITCLESRYMQKIGNRSNEEAIKSLEEKLGKIALEMKLKNASLSKQIWKSNLTNEQLESALAIGLIQYSEAVGQQDCRIEELAFSSYSGITFSHECIKEYLAVQHISNKDFPELEKVIKVSAEDKKLRILPFMFGMNHPFVDKAYKCMLKNRNKWGSLVDCIFEVEDPLKKKSMIEEMAKKEKGHIVLNVYYLNKKYHRIALNEFCNICRENKVQIRIKQLTCTEECAVGFLRDDAPPPIKLLRFKNMNIPYSQFVSIITSFHNRTPPNLILFISGKIEEKDDVDNYNLTSDNVKCLNIYRSDTEPKQGQEVGVFNIQDGTWETESFPQDLSEVLK